MAEALNHAPHITSFKVARNPKAASGFAGIAKTVAKGAVKAAEYGAKAAKIGMKVYDVLQKVSTAVTVGEKMGIIKQF